MSLADDLQKLEQLRSSGALSEEEFKQAKAKLISPPSETQRDFVPGNVQKSDGDDPLQIIFWVLGIIILLAIVFALGHHHFYHRNPFP
jgi:hypothetical protein